jgi:hypothetical protein
VAGCALYNYLSKNTIILSGGLTNMGEGERKYRFSWDDSIGADMNLARPSRGLSLRIEAKGKVS